MGLPVSASHIRAVRSAHAVTIRRPSALKLAHNHSHIAHWIAYGLAGLRIPHLRAPVTTRSGDDPSPIRAETGHTDPLFMEHWLAYGLAAPRIPDSGGAVPRRCENSPPVGVKTRRRHPSSWRDGLPTGFLLSASHT